MVDHMILFAFFGSVWQQLVRERCDAVGDLTVKESQSHALTTVRLQI